MGSIDGLFGVIAFVCGCYCCYAVYMMKKTGEINPTILLSKEIQPKKCKDKEAYLKCVIPKVTVLGIVTVLYGILTLVDAFFFSLGSFVFVMIVGMLGVLIWYAMTTLKAAKRFF